MSLPICASAIPLSWFISSFLRLLDRRGRDLIIVPTLASSNGSHLERTESSEELLAIIIGIGVAYLD